MKPVHEKAMSSIRHNKVELSFIFDTIKESYGSDLWTPID